MDTEAFQNYELSSITDDSGFTNIDQSTKVVNNRLYTPGTVKDRNDFDLKTEKLTERRETQKRSNPVDMELTLIDLPPMVKTEPAVGWMVCVEGVDKGRSFRLVKGNNTIGRPGNGKNYAVSLTDQGISRKGACGVIVYNEKTNQFFITPGDLTTNINPYLNDDILLSPQILSPRSVLEVAGDVLIFVPFCSDKFKWNFSIPKKQEQEAEALRENNKQDDIVRCKKGHYYNSKLNDTCPHCAKEEENDPDGKTKIYF